MNRRTGIFDEYYDLLQQILLQEIEAGRKEKGDEIPKIAPELLRIFTEQMQRITFRTLLFEMEICEEYGDLKGEDIGDRYGYFVENFLKNPDYRQEIYEAYPVLHEGVGQTIEDFVRNIDELLDRFAKDREEINKRFYPGNPCGEIREIGGGSSDSHRNGHRVFILELDNGEKLVYKPRSLAVDEAYVAFLRWVFLNAKISCWWNEVFDRGEYGWSGWVSAASCSSHEELERYYVRNGVLLCVNYLLGSEDMHYENLIAHGEYPVLVDLEMAVGSRGTRIEKGMTGVERFYQQSVLQTGILPLYTWNREGEGVNVGAINGKGGQLVPIVMPVVVNPGTVNMHIEYRHPTMGEGKNLATLNGKFVEPYEFLEEIQRGFERAYTFLAGNQKRVMKMLQKFGNAPVRYLVRDTQQYSMLLLTLGHPDLLISNPDRQAVWEVLEQGMQKEQAAGWIKEQEKQELLRGDVPYFYYNVCKKELCSGIGEVWKDYFDNTAMQCVENRLKHMCAADLKRQQRLIRGALFIGTKMAGVQNSERTGQGTDSFPTVFCDESINSEGNLEENRMTAAEQIADILLEEAIWSEEGREVGWISIMMAGYREMGYMIRPMNFYLYGGLAGVALFMEELARKSENEKYRNVEKTLMRLLFRHTDELLLKEPSGRRSTGAYSGESSVAFAYMLLYAGGGDSMYLSYLRKQCQAAARWLSDDTEYDVLGGNAGAILVFLKAYRMTGEKQYLVWAKEAGDCLILAARPYDYGLGWVNPSVGMALTGFAHGAAGIMLALARLGFEAQEDKYLEAAYQAYRYEEYYYREEVQDWEDLRFEEQTAMEHKKTAWCHGWGGIVMARLAAIKYAKGKFKKELEKTIDFVEKKVKKTGDENGALAEADFCLCHGKLGYPALLACMGKDGEAIRLQSQVIETICRNKAHLRDLLELQECNNYGLLGGMAGIGYGCLCEPKKILDLLCII